MNDVSSPDGSRVILFTTPCGFQITLIRTPQQELKINTHFNGSPINFTNSYYYLSSEGAALLYQNLQRIYNLIDP